MEPKAKEGMINGQAVHYSVGAVVCREGEYLLIDRNVPPLGFASVAGHVDAGETPEEALVREVKEESGLEVITRALLLEELAPDNPCMKGMTQHYWYVYNCEVAGELRQNIEETKSIGWYTIEQLRSLPFEPIWQYWFTQLHIL